MNRTTPAQRRDFYRRYLQGETQEEIARTAAVSRECVRYWCRRQRDGGSCESRYQRQPLGLLKGFSPVVRYAILRLKLEHPRWGKDRIHYHLGQRRSCRGLRLPHPSSIGRYLHQWEEFRRPRKPRSKRKPRPRPPQAAHQRWQLDFKEDIEQATGEKLFLFTLMDQYSGACVDAQLLLKPTKGRRQERITWREAQAVLRCGFAVWGTRPAEVQTDNETSLVGRAGIDFPSDFTLWLLGLGIQHLAIRAGVSTDNAEVERGHRTVHDYALVGQEKLSVPDLQRQLATAVRELAFHLPSRAKACHGQPPVVAYPALLEPPHPYHPQQELALFDMNRVDAFLASFQWTRKVDQVGYVQIGGRRRRYSIGRQYAYQQVRIIFDPEDRQLVFALEDKPQQEICRRPLRSLTAAALIGLEDPSVILPPQQLPLFPDWLKG